MKKVYIKLIEAVVTYVPCPAKKISLQTYKIVSNVSLSIEDDVISIWEFFPGDVVKCDERNGDLYAKELVSSTFPDRRIHQLIFIIVQSMGEIILTELKDYKNEIEDLHNRSDIKQKEHPIIQTWLERNCNK